jgi:DNA invertase Pin-like site-specific DNA recombinase
LARVLSSGWFSALLGAAALAVFVPGSQRNGHPRKRSEIIAERHARYQATSREIDRLVTEAHGRLPRHLAKVVGAAYVRFSTWMQDSAEDQVRSLLEFAVANGIFIPRENVFFDLGIRGYRNKREGLDQLRDVLRGRKVKVLLLFATNRLFRKVYRTLEFVEEVVSEQGVRCVFVKSGIDSANKDQWQMMLHFRAIMDEFQVKIGAEHIRAGLEGLFLEGYVYGTVTFGYRGEPVSGKLTKRQRPRCRLVVDPEEAKIVVWIFEWWVDGNSLMAIAQRLNTIPEVPLPRKSNGIGWNRNSVRAVLRRAAYRGHWSFSQTEKTFLPSRDYCRQIPRDRPLREVTFENLQIVSDTLWFAAQTRLAKNPGIRGRRPRNENADLSLRILSGLVWCQEHDRPMRACSAFGRYFGCPTCATLDAEQRPLFSKPRRCVVLRLLCEKLAELIQHDSALVDRIIAECQAHAAQSKRPDQSELDRLEKGLSKLTRAIDFNMRHSGETAEDEKQIAETLRDLRRERKAFQDQIGMVKAAALEPVRVPSRPEVVSFLENLSDVLRHAAAGDLGDGQHAARDILERLTGGRIDMYQQGERREMRGWLQGRFTIKLLDVLVEKIAGVRRAQHSEGIEVIIDFKRPRKIDADADKAIQLWLEPKTSKEIAKHLRCDESYVSRLLRIGAKRRGTTLEALKCNRTNPAIDPSRAPRYQKIADEAMRLWWDDLYPIAEVARRLQCSTVTINAAVRHWHESRRLEFPKYEDWLRRLEQRVVELFDANSLEIQEIADKVHLGRTKMMEIVRDAYRRLGRELPDGRTRRAQLTGQQTSSAPLLTRPPAN